MAAIGRKHTMEAEGTDARTLAKEIQRASARVAVRILLKEAQDPEDLVVLRGSVESLIELAEQ